MMEWTQSHRLSFVICIKLFRRHTYVNNVEVRTPPLAKQSSKESRLIKAIESYDEYSFSSEEKKMDPFRFWTNKSSNRKNIQDSIVFLAYDPLKELATALIACPSNSAAAERVFSSMGLVIESITIPVIEQKLIFQTPAECPKKQTQG